MKEKPKQILLISKCCNRGYYQSIRLIHQLNDVGLAYNLLITSPKKCKDILIKYDIDINTIAHNPIIYVEDLCFQAEKINDKQYLKKLVNDLIKINKIKTDEVTVNKNIDENSDIWGKNWEKNLKEIENKPKWHEKIKKPDFIKNIKKK